MLDSQPRPYEPPKIAHREVIEALIAIAPVGSPITGDASDQ